MSSFTHFLNNLEQQYRGLSDEEKNQTLDRLISCSESSQLFHLHQQLTCFLKRDFLALPPTELAYKMLFYLDVKTLLVACQVSQHWNSLISGCEERWMLACASNGFRPKVPRPVTSYKQLWQKSVSVLKGIKDHSAIECLLLFGHTDRVMAVFYHDGKLATGSDDRFVRIWDCRHAQCIKLFQTHTVADLKFDENILVTGSFDTTAATWNMNTGQLIKRFHGHVSAVFSIDYTNTILVTGSADSTVRVWDMESGTALKVLSQHRSAWITGVRILQYEPETRYVVLSRDNTTIYSWTLNKQQDTLNIVHDQEITLPSACLIPGLYLKDNNVRYAAYNPELSKCTVFEAKISDLNDGKPSDSISKQRLVFASKQNINSFLGSGSEFDIFLIDDCENVPRLDVIRGETRIASIEIPTQYRGSKRGSTFTLGDQVWLNGFHEEDNEGVIFAASLKDNNVFLMRWRSTELPTLESSSVS